MNHKVWNEAISSNGNEAFAGLEHRCLQDSSRICAGGMNLLILNEHGTSMDQGMEQLTHADHILQGFLEMHP